MSGIEGRCITIARVRAGMTSCEVARRLFYNDALISMWECGTREPHWDELYALLPELPKIREKGCAAYCPKADVCKKDGVCPMARASKTVKKMALQDPSSPVDFVPLVHGRWLDSCFIKVQQDKYPAVNCSNCGCSFCDVINDHHYMYHYCPHCGAKMDGGADNG